MALFLLNTMENKKSRKIGLTFLGFFYNLLEFIWLWKKKKKKNEQQYWATLAQAAQQHREKRSRACVRPRPRARWILCRKALGLTAKPK